MGEPIRVLLVDDEVDFLEAVSFWLTSQGYRVTTAESGERALTILKEERHDVVFLDVLMPKMDGIETLRRIRMFNKSLPVILVTTSTLEDEDKYVGAKALGIAGLFPKGTSLVQLGEILEVALRRIRAPRAVSAGFSSGGAASAMEKGMALLRRIFGRCSR